MDDCASICVVMASNGYPDNYEKGLPISGLEALKGLDNVQVFHAGTSLKDGKVVTNGGEFLGYNSGKRFAEGSKECL